MHHTNIVAKPDTIMHDEKIQVSFENDVNSLHKIFNMMDNYSVFDEIFQVYKHFVIKKGNIF